MSRPVALPNVDSLFASVITYQGGVALLVSGTSFQTAGEQSDAGCRLAPSVPCTLGT